MVIEPSTVISRQLMFTLNASNAGLSGGRVALFSGLGCEDVLHTDTETACHLAPSRVCEWQTRGD